MGEARHLLHVSHDAQLVTALIARDLKQYRLRGDKDQGEAKSTKST